MNLTSSKGLILVGLVKNLAMEIEERGYGEDDRFVCSNCIGCYDLENLVIENGLEEQCDFCASTAMCVTLETLASDIMDGIRFEYQEAIQIMGQERGEYIGANTFDTYDLLEKLDAEMELNVGVLDALKDIFTMKTWCEYDPYVLREHQELQFLWDEFCDAVKNETRYVFFRLPKHDEHGNESPYKILDHISNKAADMKMFIEIPKEHRFFRGRAHKKDIQFTKPNELGSPPNAYAKAGRMSADGISVFYGAGSIGTAIREIYSSAHPYASIAAFKNLRPLILLDLTKAIDLEFPSLFNKEQRSNRQSIIFLKKLCDELTRPFDELERIEYIPTQIVAEYFRYIYKYKGKQIDGIKYPSSKDKDGVCYALFFDYKQFNGEKCNSLKEIAMVQRSAKRYKICAEIRYEQII
jgi:hypothetical protein